MSVCVTLTKVLAHGCDANGNVLFSIRRDSVELRSRDKLRLSGSVAAVGILDHVILWFQYRGVQYGRITPIVLKGGENPDVDAIVVNKVNVYVDETFEFRMDIVPTRVPIVPRPFGIGAYGKWPN